MRRTALAFTLFATMTASALAQTAAPQFATVASNEMFTSKLKGLNVYNQDNKSVGEIEDVAMNATHSVDAYILSVGGFLGMGEHYVAVAPGSVDVNYDGNSKKWVAKMNVTADQLKAAPEFKYPK